MSNAIRDTEKLYNRQLESAKRRNDRELKSINNAHDALKTELKKDQANEIVEIQNQHHLQLNAEAEKKEKILSEMREHLQKTSELTDKELKNLKKNAEAEKNQTQQKLGLERERINDEHELYLQDLNDRYSRTSQKINYDGKRQIEDMKLEMGEQFTNTEKFHQKKINDQTQEFTTRFNRDTKNYQKMKDNQDNQFKKDRLSTNTRQQHELSKMTSTHTNHIESRDQEYRKALKQQDDFFEKKFKNRLDHHNTTYKSLEDKNKQVVESLKSSLTKEIAQTANRQDDEFYQFTALRPRLKKFEDRVEISVDVPEHAKQDVQVSTNIKEAIISLNRRYADANRTPDGTINKVNKVESFTTRLPTGMVLDPKSIKANYENGTMTYVIKKA